MADLVNWQVVISAIAALISVGGAFASWHMARKKFHFDAGKELGGLRVETLRLLGEVMFIGDVRHGPVAEALSAQLQRWQDLVEEKKPMLTKRAIKYLEEVEACCRNAYHGAYIEEKIDELPFDGREIAEQALEGSREKARALSEQLYADPWLFAR